MCIDQANVNNLKSLWKKYGSQRLTFDKNITTSNAPTQYINTHWPNRCWFDELIPPNDCSWLNKVPKSTIFPVWLALNNEENTKRNSVAQLQIEKQLDNNNWHCILEQTAMSLLLTNDATELIKNQFQPRISFTIKKVETAQEITLWIDIIRESFGYNVDRVVIENLINDQDMQILMAYHYDEAIATAILYKTGDIIGIHQVGVKKSFQGQGFARTLMQEIIAVSLLWQGKQVVLQASPAGKPLYDSLGFKSQFSIKSYKKKLD